MLKTAAATLAIMTAAAPCFAQETTPLAPETLGIKERIDEGPNVFAIDQKWNGASAVLVLGAEDFAVKGNIGAGGMMQFALSKDGKTIYSTSTYMTRYTYGDTTNVFHVFDVDTLSITKEFEFGTKMAMVEPQPALLALTADEAYALAQNATPATSISVIDIAAGSVVAEIPTPGCWGAFPATEGMKFTSVCGDGTLHSFTFAADGSFAEPAASEPIFSVDDDPLFTNGVRVGTTLVYVSFNGNIYTVDDSGDAPVLVDMFPISEGVLGGWKPSGSEVIAYNAANNLAFVLMHSSAYDGSHKNPAEEIWTIDLAAKKVIGRSPANAEFTLIATSDAEPVLFGSNEEGEVYRYDVTVGPEVTMEMVGDFNTGGWPAMLAVDH